MSILHEVKPLEDSPEFVAAFGAVVSDAQGKVCVVCGLERMGHGPESSWLGYASHEWQGMSADAAMIERAAQLSRDAYRARCAQNLCGAYCVSTHAA